MAGSQRAALGFRAHSGWAVVVAVARRSDEAVILDRRRLETADASMAGSKQPYHAAAGLELEKAEALIGAFRERSARLATDAVSAFIDDVTERGHTVVGSAILFASGRPLPNLAAILQAHPLIHTAEGEFFREALVRASEKCLLPVTRVKEREVWDRAAAALGTGIADIEGLLREFGRSLGPPWRQDEKLAALAGWIALAQAG